MYGPMSPYNKYGHVRLDVSPYNKYGHFSLDRTKLHYVL